MHRWQLDELVGEMSGDSEMSVAKARKILRTASAAEAMRTGGQGTQRCKPALPHGYGKWALV